MDTIDTPCSTSGRGASEDNIRTEEFAGY